MVHNFGIIKHITNVMMGDYPFKILWVITYYLLFKNAIINNIMNDHH